MSSKVPKGIAALASNSTPNSSCSSRANAARGDSPSSGLPPGWMNVSDPRLRTRRTSLLALRTTAATVRMVPKALLGVLLLVGCRHFGSRIIGDGNGPDFESGSVLVWSIKLKAPRIPIGIKDGCKLTVIGNQSHHGRAVGVDFHSGPVSHRPALAPGRIQRHHGAPVLRGGNSAALASLVVEYRPARDARLA